MNEDSSPVRPLTPPGEVGSEAASSQFHRIEASGVSEILERVRDALKERYEIEREIGRGGMAVVFLARDLQLPRRVAIKVLRPEFVKSDTARRFLREIHIEAGLQHPNIVTLFDSGQADGLPYFVMEYVEGESLRDCLVREGQFSLEATLAITRQVAEGLSYAHERKVVHRDIKPENILLSGDRALIADFGIARAAAEAGVESITPTDIVLGTPQYMSPEQCGAEPTIDHRTDIYSLACVVYEMLAGEPPFTGRTRSAIVAKQLSERVPSLKVVRRNVPAGVAAVIEKALEKVPADRFQSCGGFADALERGNVPDSPPIPQWIRRLALVSVLLLTVGVVWLLFEWVWGPDGPTVARRGADLDPTRLAVLGIEAVGSPDLEAFASNLAARLSDGLGSIDALTVISRRGVLPYVDAGIPLDSVARALKVGTLIDGNVESVGDTIRIALRLIDGRTGEQLAVTHAQAEFVERHLLMDAVADTVTRLLRQSLGPTVRMRQRLLETESIAAFERVQWAEGRLGEFQAVLGGGDFDAAERILNEWDSLLAEAERLDPNWIEPIVERAELVQWRIMLAFARGTPDDGTYLRVGLGHVERALEISPASPKALQLRGLLRYDLWSDHPPVDSAAAAELRDAAEADLRAAIDGNPDRSVVLRLLSRLTARDGRLEDAVRYAEQAYDADPYLENPGQFLWGLFQYNLELGRDEEAIRWCRLGAERLPEDPKFYHCQLTVMAWVPSEQPDTTHARTLRDQTLAYYHPSMRGQLQPHLDLLVAAVMARAGARQSAQSVVEEYLAQEPTQLGILLPSAGTLALLGDAQRALDIVEDYVREHPHDRTSIRQNPALRLLRTYERFRAILGSNPGV